MSPVIDSFWGRPQRSRDRNCRESKKTKEQKLREQWMDVCHKAAVVVQRVLNQSFQHDLWLVDVDNFSVFGSVFYQIFIQRSDLFSFHMILMLSPAIVLLKALQVYDLNLQRHHKNDNPSSLPVCGQWVLYFTATFECLLCDFCWRNWQKKSWIWKLVAGVENWSGNMLENIKHVLWSGWVWRHFCVPVRNNTIRCLAA